MKKYLVSTILFGLIIACASLVFIGGCKKREPEIQFYTVTYLVDEGGWIEGVAEQRIEYGASTSTVVAVANTGYEFVKWSDEVETAERTDENIMADKTVNAVFRKVKLTVNYKVDEGGRIEGVAEQRIEYGASTSAVVAVADAGYEFVKWSDEVETAERTDDNITADKTVKAIFKKQRYVLKYETSGNGYIEGESIQNVDYGDSSLTVTAIPEIGNKFVEWSDGLKTPTRTDRDINSDKIITAKFEKLQYTVQYLTDGGGYIIGGDNQSVEYGENAAKVTAIPNNGYRFVKWSDGKTEDTRQDLSIKVDFTVTAEFEFLFAEGKGTQLNPFIIENYQQLLNMRLYADQHYRLANDLDLTGISHEPIFDDNEPFSGYFDGNEKSITNMTVTTEKNYPSLFGVNMGGIIFDLTLSNVNITTTDFNTLEAGINYYVGAVAGYSVGFLNNISVDGKITVDGLTYDGVAVGGLAGMAFSTVADCVVDIQITVRNVQREHKTNMFRPFLFGGLLGVCDSAHISNCVAQGEIRISDSYKYENVSGQLINKVTDICIGGLVGYYFTNRQVNTDVTESKTCIAITGDNHYDAGGFIGQLQVADKTSLKISDNSVNGDIKTGVVGGFINVIYSYGYLLIDNCNVENDITAFSSAAGFVLECFSYNKNLEITCCRTVGKVEVHRFDDAQRVVGEAGGFSSMVQGVQLFYCFAERNLKSSHSIGFSLDITECNISACYYTGIIEVGGSGNKNFHGIGFAMDICNSEIYDCFVNADIFYERVERLNGFVRDIENSEIKNFYVAGQCAGKLIDGVKNSTIINGHVINTACDSTLQEGIDITFYNEPKEMFNLAEKLNGGRSDEIWVNVENSLPQFKLI